MDDKDRAELVELQYGVEQAQADLDAALTRRNERLRELYRRGIGPTAMARALSEARPADARPIHRVTVQDIVTDAPRH